MAISEATRAKLRARKPYWLGKKRSLETIEKIRIAKKGFRHTAESKAKIGRIGEQNKNWKGDDARYIAKHHWIARKLGKANHCDLCWKVKVEGQKKGQFHWSNLDHKYRRNIMDWWQLCVKCHIGFDRVFNAKKVNGKTL